MKIFTRLFIFAVLLCGFGISYADSILTSTEFYYFYTDVPQVWKAAENKNTFTKAQKQYLVNDTVPFDKKIALVNAFSWNHEGDYFGEFLGFLKDRFPKSKYNIPANQELSDEEFYKYATAEELVLLAYLKAMDDFNEEEVTLDLVERALKKDHPNSQSFWLPVTLIQTHIMSFNDQDNEIYPTVEKQLLLAPIHDMRYEAMDTVMDYLYYFKR